MCRFRNTFFVLRGLGFYLQRHSNKMEFYYVEDGSVFHEEEGVALPERMRRLRVLARGDCDRCIEQGQACRYRLTARSACVSCQQARVACINGDGYTWWELLHMAWTNLRYYRRRYENLVHYLNVVEDMEIGAIGQIADGYLLEE